MSFLSNTTAENRKFSGSLALTIFLFCLFFLSLQNIKPIFGQTAGGILAGRMVLLDFTSDHCPACKAVEPLMTELAKKNYPIQRVDPTLAQDQELYARYRITSTPSYVMLLDGQEVDRFIGQGEGMDQLKPILLRMFEQTYAKMQTVSSETAAVQNPAAVQNLAAAPMNPAQNQQFSAQTTSAQTTSAQPAENLSAEMIPLMAATVRLRAGNGNQSDCGTGTLIHSNVKNGNNEGLVLTCGHLFRDTQGKGAVEVDLFDASGKRVTTVMGECVWYDGDLDIGFVGIPLPASIRAASLVPPGYLPKAGDSVVSIGCTGGDDPTVWTHKILSTDQKFHQPVRSDGSDESFYYIEVSNAPKQGRSGGGLFVRNADGQYSLLGLCNAGDTGTNEGYFLPSSVIYHQLLSNQNLAFVYEEILRASTESKTPDQQTAAAAVPAPAMPAQNSAGFSVSQGASAPAEAVAAAPLPGAPMTAQTTGAPDQIAPAQIASAQIASVPSADLISTAENAVSAAGNSINPVGFEAAGFGNPAQNSTGILPAEKDAFAASVEELRRMHEQGAEIICIVNWPEPANGKKESDVIRLNPKP